MAKVAEISADDIVPASPKPAQAASRKRLRMILLGVALLLVVFVVVAWQWDQLVDRVVPSWVGSGARPSAPISSYSGAQGAQDAPRAEQTESRRADRSKCLETLRLRRVAPETARDSCEKMVNGIYH